MAMEKGDTGVGEGAPARDHEGVWGQLFAWASSWPWLGSALSGHHSCSSDSRNCLAAGAYGSWHVKVIS